MFLYSIRNSCKITMDVNSFGQGESSSTINEPLASNEAVSVSESDVGVAKPLEDGGALRELPVALRRPLKVVISQDYIGVLFAIIVLVTVISVVHPNFLQVGQLTDILSQAAYVVLLASGMAFLLAMGELDLSIGGIFGLTAICSALLIHSGMPSWAGFIVGIVIGAALGLCNALIIQFVRLPAFVATLATASIFRGLAFALSNGEQIAGPAINDPFSQIVGAHFLGIPTNAWVLVIVVVILAVVLQATPFGYRVRSIGSNREAAVFSGLPINRVRILGFVLSGVMGALAGMLALGYFGAADPSYGSGDELLAVAAAVIGGTALSGGKASVVGAMFGGILLGVVGSGLAYFNIPLAWDAFATGVVILLAVALDSLLRRVNARRNA